MPKAIKDLLTLGEGHHQFSVVFYVLKIAKRMIASDTDKQKKEKAVYNVTIIDAEVRTGSACAHACCAHAYVSASIHAQKTEHQLSYWSEQELGRLAVGGYFVAKGVKVKVCARAWWFCHGFVVLCAR